MPTIKMRKYKDSVYIIYTHKMRVFKIFTGVKVEDKYVCAPKKNCPGLDICHFQVSLGAFLLLCHKYLRY
jgi:hypothetical protein